MSGEKKKKTKMVMVSTTVYHKLLQQKHVLECSSDCSWSFSNVIDWLLENKRHV